MKKLTTTIVLLSLIQLRANAQSTFQKLYGGVQSTESYSGFQTYDRGFILLGETSDFGAGLNDVYLVKTDTLGNILWTRTIGRPLHDWANCIRMTKDDGYIICGMIDTADYLNFEASLIKTDTSGNVIWSKTYGGPGNEWCNFVEPTSDGGYVLTGYSDGFTNTYTDMYVVKTNNIGDTLWSRIYSGFDDDRGQCIRQTIDGGYIIVGFTRSFGSGAQDVYLIKTDSSGIPQWSKTYGGSAYDFGNSVLQTPDGGYIVLGYTNSFGAGGYDVLLLKTDSAGNLQWAKTYGGAGLDEGLYLGNTSDGGYVLAGYSGSVNNSENAYLLKTDSTGNLEWSKVYSGTNGSFGNYAEQTTDGGYMISGYVGGFVPGQNAYLIKTDANGNSGCYEQDVVTVVTSPSLITGDAATQLIFPPTVVKTLPVSQSSGGSAMSLCLTMNISEMDYAESQIGIYPNPAHSFFTVSLDEQFIMQNAELKIYDVIGREVFAVRIEQKLQTLHLNLSPAVYFVRVGDRKNALTRKLVIE